MRNFWYLIFTLSFIFNTFAHEHKSFQNDSVYLFAYSTEESGGKSGMLYALSEDGVNWKGIGPEFRFLFSDYGTWGAQKRLINPYLFESEKGQWNCIWTLNHEENVFAFASSKNLIDWEPQLYPSTGFGSVCNNLTASYNQADKSFTILWEDKSKFYSSTTKDFKEMSAALETNPFSNQRTEVKIGEKTRKGIIRRISAETAENLLDYHEFTAKRDAAQQNYREGVKYLHGSLKADLTIHAEKSKAISTDLIGVFFEDINYAADGGLYAELIQNRDFEYNETDKKGHDKNWNSLKAWEVIDGTIETENPIHENNPHFLRLYTENSKLTNEGWNGIVIKKDDSYIFSLFARNNSQTKKELKIALHDKKGKTVANLKLKIEGKNWKKYKGILKASNSISDGKLVIHFEGKGSVDLDMISLFPQNTYKNRENGLRKDLAETVAAIKPRFVRFPGGCVSHGDGLHNIYKWKTTIGPLESRKPMRNLWGYHQTTGLGYFEYFQFCEDMGAEPLPVIAAGVPCQNSSDGGAGQQGGVPMCDMDQYIQDILDLIEWANGDVHTVWGKKRAEAGHPKPFHLKYLGIGNEDLITDLFKERYLKIIQAVEAKYPQIEVIGTVGPFFEGTDYRVGWEIAKANKIDMVDEHYYVSPGWYVNNQNFYDKYERNSTNVYLGEYASHVPGRHNNMETALSEALHLANIERNADVVTMTSYAPMLAKEGFTQWSPDLIYFNNSEVKPTVGYQVQKLYGNNSGDKFIQSELTFTDQISEQNRKLAVQSVVKDSKTGELIIKLVNILPVEIETSIQIEDQNIRNKKAECFILKGELNDKDAKPEKTTIDVSNKFNFRVPAQSFCVIKLKAENPKYKLIWADEFNSGIKAAEKNWIYEEGFVRNNEAQWYQKENAFVENGCLIIEARKENRPNPHFEENSQDWRTNRKTIQYSSSCLTSRGKFEFTYGRMEVKARIDTSMGLWPAIWTLGIDKQWPSNGEIDIMESYPTKGTHYILANVASGTNKQYNAKWDSEKIPLSHFLAKDPEWPSKFHLWRMDWDRNKIKLYLDDELLNEVDLVNTINPDGFQPFHQPQYILLNLALGGQNGGDLSHTKFPSRFEIDYVRVYSLETSRQP